MNSNLDIKKLWIIPIKIWSDSLIDENTNLAREDVISKIAEDINYIIRNSNQRFIIITSWSVKYWKAIATTKEMNLNYLTKADFAQMWQVALMNMWNSHLGQYWLEWNQLLLWETINMKHASTSLLRQILSWRIPIINYNDWASNVEIEHLVDHTDNDKTLLLVVEMFYRLVNELLTNWDDVSKIKENWQIIPIIKSTWWEVQKLIKNVVFLTNKRWIEDTNWNSVSWGEQILVNDTSKLLSIHKELRSHIIDTISNWWTWGMREKLLAIEVLSMLWINCHISKASDWLASLDLNNSWISTRITFKD